jgi:hypothetical protein
LGDVERKRMSPRAEDFDLDNAIHAMPSQFIQCRDFGHLWRPRAATWVAEKEHYETELKCQRCKTVRLRYIGPRGELLKSGYDYSAGYVVTGMGRLDGAERDLLRLESVLRVLPAEEQQTPATASAAVRKAAPRKAAATGRKAAPAKAESPRKSAGRGRVGAS